MDKVKFFNYLRPTNIKLTSTNVPGFDVLLDEAVKRKTNLHFLAYMLATTYWETAHTMQPIREKGGNAYFKRMYDIQGNRPKVARTLGNLTPGDGVKFHGRGYVQITGRTNYEKASKKLGVDFVANPELVMEPANAVRILFDGMEEGWFTGRSLSDYIDGVDDPDAKDHKEFTDARRIINGVDKAKQIADLAIHFEKALQAGAYNPNAKPLYKSKTMCGVALASIAPIAEIAQEVATNIHPLIGYSESLRYIFLAASVVGIVMVAVQRVKDAKEGVK